MRQEAPGEWPAVRTAPVRPSTAERHRRITEAFQPSREQLALIDEFEHALLNDFVYSVKIAQQANVVLDRRAREAEMRAALDT